MSYERIIAHPFRSEAVSINGNGVLTRWTLGNEPIRLVEVITEYDRTWMDLAVAPTGDTFFLVNRTDRVERRRWDDLELIGQIDCPTGTEPHRVAVSPDGGTIAVSGFGIGDYLLDASSGQITTVLSGEPGLYVRFSPDGRWLACAENGESGGTLFLYQIEEEGKLSGRYALKTFEPSTFGLVNPVFSPDSQWITVCESNDFTAAEESTGWFGNLRIFAVEAGAHRWSTALESPNLPEDIVERAEYERLLDPTNLYFGAGEIICGMPTGDLAFFSVETGERTRLIPMAPGIPITGVSVDPSQEAIWAVMDGGQVKAVPVPVSNIRSPLPPRPTPSLPQVLELDGHERSINDLAYAPDGSRIVTVSADQTARVWDAASGQELLTLELRMEAVTVAYSRDGSHIAVGGESLIVFNAVTGEETLRFTDEAMAFLQIVFSPDGNYLLCSLFGHVARLLDASTGKTVLILDNPQRKMESAFRWLTYLPDGRYFAAVTEMMRVEFWQAPHGPRVSQFLQNETDITFLAFSDSGRRCLTGGWTNKLWDVAAGKLLAEYEGLSPSCFSPDGTLAAGVDETIFGAKIWNALTGKELHRMTGHGDSVGCIAFAPDGKHIATGSWDRTVKIWRIPS
ncbi:MAG: (Myosin heavy-chain) kinase Histone acetyltransferase [Chthonomonadaceae bacterium]|nr:(Myosin heavy-chain) kinase Histone acetyltransferase [Chthonomonadaceae bacterium]